MPTTKYDDVEAKDLISTFAEQVSPSTDAMIEASRELLVTFSNLMQDAGYRPDPILGVDVVEFRIRGREAMVGVDRSGLFVSGEEDGERIRLRIVYDRQTRMLRSTEKETFRAPAPGQPIPYRSAFAELAQATVARLNASGRSEAGSFQIRQ